MNLANLSQNKAEEPVLLKYVGLALSTNVNEELALISAGLLARGGQLAFVPAVCACVVFICVMNLAMWSIGSALAGGTGWASRRFPKTTARHQPKVEAFAARIRGGAYWPLMGATRFIPGSKTPFFIACGYAGVPFWRFAWTSSLVSTVSALVLASLAFAVGQPLLEIFN